MTNLKNNHIPEQVKKVHLIAVCGTGMGALACILKDQKIAVTGSDQQVYPPMSDFLVKNGIKINQGFDKENLSYHPDLVVVGNTVKKDNPEVIAMDELGLCFCSMPQAINRFAVQDKKPVLVVGTHGKTTTSSILAWILYHANLDPSFMIGGILNNFHTNYGLGKGEYIIIEGDEYDSAFFDKRSKFLHYDPYIAILTSVEFDHADIFKDLDHVKQAFDSFICKISHTNTLIAFDDNPNIDQLVQNRYVLNKLSYKEGLDPEGPVCIPTQERGNENYPDLLRSFQNRKCLVERYGKKPGSNWRIQFLSFDSPWTKFEVFQNNKKFGTFKTKLMGQHNLFNLLSAIAVAHKLKIKPEIISSAIETFKGIKRRQQVCGEKNGITVIDDFAHHPTAVHETTHAVKSYYPNSRLIAVFEPRTNSSMRSIFQDVYPKSFDKADIICIREPSLLNRIPYDQRFSSQKLTDDLKKRGKDAHFFQDTESIIDFLVKTAQSKDIILIMSNGGFDNIHERLLDRLGT